MYNMCFYNIIRDNNNLSHILNTIIMITFCVNNDLYTSYLVIH